MSRSYQPTLVRGDQVRLTKHSVIVEKFLRSESLLDEHRVESYSVLVKRLLHPEPFWQVGTLRKIPRPSKYLLEAALRESDILNLIREEGGHPHIVELIDLSRDNDLYYLFADEEIGTLSDIVSGFGRERRKMSEKEVLEIAFQICEAVSFLHNFQPPLIHRNITPNNIVITSKNVVKLSGFIGVALELAPYALAETKIPALLQDILCYTDPLYRCSPEMADPQIQSGITAKADVWSMGVVLYFIAFNQSLTLFDSDLFGDVYYNSRGYRHVVAIIGSTMRRDPKMRPAIKDVRDKIRAICGIRTPLPADREALRVFPSEKRFYKSFIMPRDSYMRHLAPRVVPTHLGIPPSFPGFTSQQGSTSNWSPPRLLTSLLNDFPRLPGMPRLPRLPLEDEEQAPTEGDSSFHDTDSKGVDFLSDNESTRSQEEAESEGVYNNPNLDDIGPASTRDSKKYLPSSHGAIKATKNASSSTSQPLDGTLRTRSVAPRWVPRPLPDKNEISTPVKPNQINGTSISQNQRFHGARDSTSNSAGIVGTMTAPAETPLPLPPRGILKKGSNNSDSRVSRPSTPGKKPQDRKELENLTSMRTGPSSDSFPRGQSSTRPQGRSNQETTVSEKAQTAGVDIDRQSETSSLAPSENSTLTLGGQLQTNSTDQPSRTPSPLVDDISSQITWISPTASKVNGHFCDVFEGKHSTAGKVALKRPRIGATGYDAVIIRRFEREAVTWRSLKHPHILEFLGTFQRDGHLYFVSPYIENGTLVEYVVRYPDVNRIRLLCETAEAVYYLHKKGIVHADIKASNILIDDHGHSLLCDFGLTKMTQSRTSTSMRGAGTVRWQSPELWNDAPKSAETDVYAFAMTIVEVLTGKPPFGHLLNDMTVMLAVIQHDERPPRSPLTSSTGASYERTWDVAAACWAKEPDKRITMFTAFERLSADLSLL